jgi:predicted peptidase
MKTLHALSGLVTLSIVFGLSSLVATAAEPAAGKQVERSFKAKDSGEVPYLLYLPDNYEADAKDKLPIMLFLHGRGESDGPLSLVAKWGPPLLAARGEDFPFIIVSPQCPREDSWSSDTQQARLSQLLEATIQEFGADRQRVYLAGLSMGGSGSWRMAADHPELFAAVVPICGRGDVANAEKLKSLPIWVFVGDQDRVFQANVDMVEAIRAAGSQNVRLTTLENIGHNSWSAAFASRDLYAWLAKQSRSQK